MAGAFAVKTEAGQVLAGLDQAEIAVTDVRPLLQIADVLMRASIARTFRDEGSPAGSWPRLAASTMKKKAYTSGHKLLILSGRLFGSIAGLIGRNTLTIGTNLVYAAVQNFGSADRRGGSIGAQAKLAGRAVDVPEHEGSRASFNRHGKGVDAKGRSRTMRLRGPANRTQFKVGAHTRHQNIPARQFLVFRPEDPARVVEGFQAYLAGKLVRVGKVSNLAGGAA